jgi:hypothetical protein
MEAEARSILSEAVAGDRDQPEPNLAEAIRRRFAPLGGADDIESPRADVKAGPSRPSMRKSQRQPVSPAPSSRPAMWGISRAAASLW